MEDMYTFMKQKMLKSASNEGEDAESRASVRGRTEIFSEKLRRHETGIDDHAFGCLAYLGPGVESEAPKVDRSCDAASEIGQVVTLYSCLIASGWL